MSSGIIREPHNLLPDNPHNLPQILHSHRQRRHQYNHISQRPDQQAMLPATLTNLSPHPLFRIERLRG